MSFDVLDHHGPVIYENADGQGETAERHRVKRLASQIHHQHGGHDRHRNRCEDDQRQAPVTEEEQDHQRCKAGCHQASHHDAVQCRLDKNRLVENRLDSHAFGQQPPYVGKVVPDAVNDGQGRDAPGLANGHQGAGCSVDRNGIGLHLIAIVNMGDVLNKDRAAIDLLDRKSIDGGDDIGTVVHRQRIVLAADFHVAGGQNDVLSLKGFGDVARRQAARVQRILVEVGHDDSGLATVRIGNFGPLHDR